MVLGWGWPSPLVCQPHGISTVQNPGMMQLSIVGPPEETRAIPRRQGLHRRVYYAIAARWCGLEISSELIHDAADAVVEELIGGSQGINSREALLRLCDGQTVCWICGKRIPLELSHDEPAAFSIDHVVPRSEGGTQLGFSNLKPAHRFCNNLRGQKRLRRRTREKYDAFLASFDGD